jgi:hypothetical protein
MAMTLTAATRLRRLVGELKWRTMVIPEQALPNPPTRFDLSSQGRLTAAMAILNLNRSTCCAIRIYRWVSRRVTQTFKSCFETPLGKGIT